MMITVTLRAPLKNMPQIIHTYILMNATQIGKSFPFYTKEFFTLFKMNTDKMSLVLWYCTLQKWS